MSFEASPIEHYVTTDYRKSLFQQKLEQLSIAEQFHIVFSMVAHQILTPFEAGKILGV